MVIGDFDCERIAFAPPRAERVEWKHTRFAGAAYGANFMEAKNEFPGPESRY
jgi:hypothetical protein